MRRAGVTISLTRAIWFFPLLCCCHHSLLGSLFQFNIGEYGELTDTYACGEISHVTIAELRLLSRRLMFAFINHQTIAQQCRQCIRTDATGICIQSGTTERNRMDEQRS